MKAGIVIPLLVALAASVYAGHHGHGWGQGYFQYANVPAYGQYEFGYNRGNHDHYTSRYEQGHDWRVRTKVRWGDKKGGYGEHYYDYNHVDKGDKGHGHGWGKGHGHQSHGHTQHHGHGHGHGWGHQHGSYSENIPQVASVKNSQNKPPRLIPRP